MTNETWVLVDSKAVPVTIGSLITSNGNEEYFLKGYTPPHKPSSTGRVIVVKKELEGDEFAQTEFFPTVFNLKICQVIKNDSAFIFQRFPIAGGEGSAPGEFILCKLLYNKITPFAVWFYNYQDQGFHNGTYCETIEKAQEAFRERISPYDHNGRLVQSKAKAKRWANAIGISAGAINPSGISLTIHEACKECIAESTDMRTDPAIKLMVHQLAFIMGNDAFNSNLDAYSQALTECRRMEAKNKE